jgi:hypothetical protein
MHFDEFVIFDALKLDYIACKEKRIDQRMAEKLDKARKKHGRPPNPPELRRSQRVVTFLTSDEMELLNQLAEAEQVSLSAAAHQLILQGLSNAKTPAQ